MDVLAFYSFYTQVHYSEHINIQELLGFFSVLHVEFGEFICILTVSKTFTKISRHWTAQCWFSRQVNISIISKLTDTCVCHELMSISELLRIYIST